MVLRHIYACSILLGQRIGFPLLLNVMRLVLSQSYIPLLYLLFILIVNNSLLTVKSVIDNMFLLTQLILDCTSESVNSRFLNEFIRMEFPEAYEVI